VGVVSLAGGTSGAIVDEGFEEVIIDDLEVGPYPVYILYFMISIFFEWFGFAISYFLSQSHAAQCGSISGLGVTVALQSLRVEELARSSDILKNYPSVIPIITFIFAFTGYVLFLFGIFAYHRRRIEAREMLALNVRPIRPAVGGNG